MQQGSAARSAPGHLFRYLAVYTVLRVALVVVLTVALSFFMPLIVALLFAIIAQLPLAWLLFAGPRRRVNEAIAEASAQRRAERARLQSALSGDVDPS
jgi:Flp pilus assembly protein TadB